jgi:hypothetical protein
MRPPVNHGNLQSTDLWVEQGDRIIGSGVIYTDVVRTNGRKLRLRAYHEDGTKVQVIRPKKKTQAAAAPREDEA